MRTRIINLTALSLLLSLAETFIPRPLPFFRIGLANIPMLLAIGKLGGKDYLTLALFKAVSTSYLSGTLFSPFFLISLGQSMASATIMYMVSIMLDKHVSLYGISLSGAAASAFAQIAIASLIIGIGIFSLLPLMLIFSFFSSLITAYISYRIPFDMDRKMDEGTEHLRMRKSFTIVLLSSSLIITTLDHAAILTIAFILMIIISLKEGRRFEPLNYIALIAITLFTSIIIPRGLVLFSIFGFPISQLSIEIGLRTGLRLSLIMIISLTFSRYMFSGGMISSILRRFFSMESIFYDSKGSLKERFISALNETEAKEMKDSIIKVPYFTSITMLCCFILLKLIDWKIL